MKLNDDVRISTSGRLYDFWVLTLVVESMSLSTRRNNLAVVETIETIGGSTGREVMMPPVIGRFSFRDASSSFMIYVYRTFNFRWLYLF